MDDLKKQIRNEFNSKIRNEQISRYPFCQYCGKKAEHVHHIIPIVSGGDNRESNLISLCLECHGLIHSRKFLSYDKIKERQMAGIRKAQEEGKFVGRKIKEIDKEKYLKLKNEYYIRRITKGDFAKQLGVSRPTLDKILKEEDKYFKNFKEKENIDI